MAGFVQVTGSVSVGATQDTVPMPVTAAAAAGNTLIAVVKGSLGASCSSVSDTAGNTWTVDVSSGGSGPTVAIARSVLDYPLGTSDTITALLSSSSAFNTAMTACEYAGGYGAPDVTYAASLASGTSWTVTASSATSRAGELVAAGIGLGGYPAQSGGFTVTGGTPAPALRVQASASPGLDNAAQADGTAAGTLTPSVSWAWLDSESAVAVIASYPSPAVLPAAPVTVRRVTSGLAEAYRSRAARR